MTLDIVLQVLGNHSWNVSGGFVNAAKRLGILNRVFRPTEQSDDGLWDYLTKCQSDFMLLCGFDWHSKSLHKPDRWLECKAKKIVYAQESILGHQRLTGNDWMVKAAQSADRCCDFWVFTDIGDCGYVGQKPFMWMPFGVDLDTFRPTIPFGERSNMPFFRGKIDFCFDGPRSKKVRVYQKRKELAEMLIQKGMLEVQKYDDNPMDANAYCHQLNCHKIVVNFPSVYPGMPTRVTESMASGCCTITNYTKHGYLDSAYENHDRVNGVCLYDADRPDTLIDAVNFCRNSNNARIIADAGLEVVKRYGLDFQLETILRKASMV